MAYVNWLDHEDTEIPSGKLILCEKPRSKGAVADSIFSSPDDITSHQHECEYRWEDRKHRSWCSQLPLILTIESSKCVFRLGETFISVFREKDVIVIVRWASVSNVQETTMFINPPPLLPPFSPNIPLGIYTTCVLPWGNASFWNWAFRPGEMHVFSTMLLKTPRSSTRRATTTTTTTTTTIIYYYSDAEAVHCIIICSFWAIL